MTRADDAAANPIDAEFRDAAEEARALAEPDLVGEVTIASRADWRAAAWLLSHSHRDERGDARTAGAAGSPMSCKPHLATRATQ